MSLWPLVGGVALLAANGFFVASEFALLAARRSRLEQIAAEGDRRADQALAGIRELSLMLAGAQLGITMASLGLGAVAEPALHHGLEALLHETAVPRAVSSTLSFAIALAVVVFLHMVVGEMAPKSWAISHPEDSSLILARPFRVFVVVFRPFIALLNTLANGVVRLCGVSPTDTVAATHSPAELLMVMDASAVGGLLGQEQHELLTRALELPRLDAQAVMVPRHDIVAVPAEADITEIEHVASATGRSRMPVYQDELDRILGVLHVKDLFDLDEAERHGLTARSLARPALITPESRPLENLMLDMRQQRQHIAIVVDEYGTVTGLAALEDLLEEIIGEFADESDRRPRPLRERPDGSLLVPAHLRPDELADRAGVELPEGEWETIAGFVIAELGRLPNVGDEVSTGDARLVVTKTEGNRLLECAVYVGEEAP